MANYECINTIENMIKIQNKGGVILQCSPFHITYAYFIKIIDDA